MRRMGGVRVVGGAKEQRLGIDVALSVDDVGMGVIEKGACVE